MCIDLEQQPPEGALIAAVDALLAEDPVELDPVVALHRATILQAQLERLGAVSLTAIADVDGRELFALDGAGSTQGWLRTQLAGDQGQLSLARRLKVRTTVRDALQHGTIDRRAAANVCTSLQALDDLEARPVAAATTPIDEDQVLGVLLHAVPDLLRPWAGYDEQTASALADDADLRREVLGRRELLAQVLTTAAEQVGGVASHRFEPVFTLLARALAPAALANALSTILDALEPHRLVESDEEFERLKHFDLIKRPGRGSYVKGLVDDDVADDLKAYLHARMRRSSGQPDVPDGPSEPTQPAGPTEPADADQPTEPQEATEPGQPSLFGDTEDRFGAAGPGTPLTPYRSPHFGTVEGPPGAGQSTRLKRYAAFVSLLRDAADAPPGSGKPAPPQLLIVASQATLLGKPGAPPGRLQGQRTSNLSRPRLGRLLCDSEIAAVLLDAQHQPVAASGTHRSFTPRERRALRAQWGNDCATNGCGLPWDIPHHVNMFSRTGITALKDGVPLCESHHRDVHESKRTLRLRDGRLLNEDGWAGDQDQTDVA